MDYKNKFYEMLRNMSACCDNCICNSCIYFMGDKCCIQDLFRELGRYSPSYYEDVYIKWFRSWEVIYNELYE